MLFIIVLLYRCYIYCGSCICLFELLVCCINLLIVIALLWCLLF